MLPKTRMLSKHCHDYDFTLFKLDELILMSLRTLHEVWAVKSPVSVRPKKPLKWTHFKWKVRWEYFNKPQIPKLFISRKKHFYINLTKVLFYSQRGHINQDNSKILTDKHTDRNTFPSSYLSNYKLFRSKFAILNWKFNVRNISFLET